ncbi:uncharacterized protein LOC129262802 [Lytechinus pictus]|uniref:uncharacterized protein LOC129262802 n=1 Tax=Lytechinus pictus TaxID=7653 RepID=UPI0030B9FC1D
MSPLSLHACYVYTTIFTIIRFATNSCLGVEALMCDSHQGRTSTTTTTTAYYNEEEQPLTICHERTIEEILNKNKLHVFEVDETIHKRNDLALAEGTGVMTATIRTSYHSSPLEIAFVVATHAVNLDVFVEGDGTLSKVFLITPWKIRSSVSVTSITTTPQIVQLDCSDVLTKSTKLVFTTTSNCEVEQYHHYFSSSSITTVTQTERADEWIIDLR